MKPENPHKDLPYGIRNRDLCYDNDDMQEEKHDAWQEGCDSGYQAGYEDGVADRIKWEQEPCTEHEQTMENYWFTKDPQYKFYPKHRYLCPECMKEESWER